MDILKNFINGCWADHRDEALLAVNNPATGEVIAQLPLSTDAHVDQAVQAASTAFSDWRQVPASRRVSYLFDLRARILECEDELVTVLMRESGKSTVDARAEMKRAVENIESACGMPILQMGDKLVGSSTGIDGEVLRFPLGVFGMIAPFNFPAMVPFWFFPYAVASGNTFVLKISEQTPMTFNRITTLIERVGFPPGVFNLLNGDGRVAQALIEHPDIRGISFVGSSSTAREVYERCSRHGKRCQAMGGAKNHLVVMPDAPLESVIRNMVTSCYGCAGQRCMASSVIVPVGDENYARVTDAFIAASRRLCVANPLASSDHDCAVGPVISAAAKARILALIDDGIEEGATLALDGRDASTAGGDDGYYVGPTVFTDVRPGMTIHQTEIFGPVVAIMPAATLDDAIAIINSHPYGNGASLYTQSGYAARQFKINVLAGMIGINVGIPAPVAALPFGGTKQSMYADIKAQGKDVIDFFTESKIVTERYWPDV